MSNNIRSFPPAVNVVYNPPPRPKSPESIAAENEHATGNLTKTILWGVAAFLGYKIIKKLF
ncbi:MAG TPA: hypothetical protein PLG30_14185 [Bacteroidia bacterium]|nr:hypothetical protein [Bacteroidia bacterium]